MKSCPKARPASASVRTGLAAGAIAVALDAGAAAGGRNDADQALYPAAQCAALWYGYDDYARLGSLLDRDERDLARAEAFRAVAYGLDEGRTARVDAFIARQRGLMTSMIDAMVYAGDDQSRDLFRRLIRTCEAFADEHPETRALR